MDGITIVFIASLIFVVSFAVGYRYSSSKKEYVVNYYTKEIHKIESNDTRCQIRNMTNCKEINKFEMRRLLKNGYNGCRHCLQELDTDKK